MSTCFKLSLILFFLFQLPNNLEEEQHLERVWEWLDVQDHQGLAAHNMVDQDVEWWMDDEDVQVGVIDSTEDYAPSSVEVDGSVYEYMLGGPDSTSWWNPHVMRRDDEPEDGVGQSNTPSVASQFVGFGQPLLDFWGSLSNHEVDQYQSDPVGFFRNLTNRQVMEYMTCLSDIGHLNQNQAADYMQLLSRHQWFLDGDGVVVIDDDGDGEC